MRFVGKLRTAGLSGCLAFCALCMCAGPLLALDSIRALTAYGQQTWRTDSGLPQNTIHSILQTQNGYIWLATEGGLVRFDGLKFSIYDSHNTPQLKSDNIRRLFEDGQHALWIETAEGYVKFSHSRFETVPPPAGTPVFNSHRVGAFGSGRVICRYQDREGVTWVGTDTGLVRIRNNKFERFPADDSLSSSIVLSLFEDREGSIWVGTDSDGVTILRDRKFTSYTAKDGLPADLVRCILQDRSGTVWIGTDAGLGRFKAGRFSVITTQDGLSSNAVISLAQDARGNLLVGTPDGLNIFDGRQVRVITSSDGLPDDFVRSIYTDVDGSLWIGTRRGLAHSTAGTYTTYTKQDGLGSDLVGSVLRDGSGNLWAGTLHGVTRMRNGELLTYSQRDGLSGGIVTSLLEGANGVLWIGTQDGGLNRFESGKFFHYPQTTALPRSIYSMLEDSRGRLWLASKTGIFRVDTKELDSLALGRATKVSVAAFGTLDGLTVSECSGSGHPGAWKAQDGALWFATVKGLATVQPLSAEAEAQPTLPIAIESVSVDGQPISPAQASEIGPGHSRIAFEYAGLSFIAPQTVRFKYKLEGFDNNWIDAGTRRVAYYTNLPPAKYRFRVLGRTNDGAWNESGETFAFRLLPRFYQTYWFNLLLICALALLAWQAYRRRVTAVQQRFDAVLAERNRIAREIHDTLAQGFVGLSIQLDLIARALSNSKEAAQDLLTQAQASVQSSLAEARRSIWELRSQGSETEDLPSKLSKIATEVNSRTSVKAQFQVFGTRRPLPRNFEDELVKIGREAVRNAVRHADASNVRIDLSFEPERLVLAITDDGRGFCVSPDGSGPSGHFGLKGMRERAQEIRADLKIKSAPGQGAQILVQAAIA